MEIIEIIYQQPNSTTTNICFTSQEQAQQWIENYPEYTVLEIIVYDLDDDIGDLR